MQENRKAVVWLVFHVHFHKRRVNGTEPQLFIILSFEFYYESSITQTLFKSYFQCKDSRNDTIESKIKLLP